MGNFSWSLRATVIPLACLLAAFCGNVNAGEEGPASGRGGVYQRHAYPSAPNRGGSHDGPGSRWTMPQNNIQVNAGSFQRPYPYHLDYYRMRYGGSYAPYFGNLYGPPQVVTAPPYYGPYYGGYGGGYGFQGDAFQGANGFPPGLCPCPGNTSEPVNNGDAATAAAANTTNMNAAGGNR